MASAQSIATITARRQAASMMVFLPAKKGRAQAGTPRRLPKRIVFLKTGALGDVLLTTPLVRAVRKAFPRAELVYYTGAWSAPALAGNPSLDRVETFPDQVFFSRRAIFGIVRLLMHLREEHADVLFCLDRALAFNLLCAATRIPVRVGFDRRGSGKGLTCKVPYGDPTRAKHNLHSYLDLLLALEGRVPGSSAKDYIRAFGADYSKMDLVVSPAARSRAARLLGPLVDGKGPVARDRLPLVALIPGGAKNPGQAVLEKRWPVEDYVALASLLLRAGRDVVVVGGRTDRDCTPAFSELAHPRGHSRAVSAGPVAAGRRGGRLLDLIGKTTLEETAAILDLAAVTVCNDSGPMHVAATTRTSIIAIFGPTDPLLLAPLNGRHHVVKRQSRPTYEDGKVHPGRTRRITRIAVTPMRILKIIDGMIRR